MTIYQLKIQLRGIANPTVWRRILIPSEASFADLHNVIQAAFGWEDYHCHHFVEIDDFDHKGWRVSDDEDPECFWEYINFKEKDIPIAQFLNSDCEQIDYTYDFGDHWVHEITLETLTLKEFEDVNVHTV